MCEVLFGTSLSRQPMLARAICVPSPKMITTPRSVRAVGMARNGLGVVAVPCALISLDQGELLLLKDWKTLKLVHEFGDRHRQAAVDLDVGEIADMVGQKAGIVLGHDIRLHFRA